MVGAGCGIARSFRAARTEEDTTSMPNFRKQGFVVEGEMFRCKTIRGIDGGINGGTQDHGAVIANRFAGHGSGRQIFELASDFLCNFLSEGARRREQDGGRFDIVSQRIIEFLQSFPDLILAMAIAMALGAGIGTVIVAIAITRIPFGGRVIRSVVLSLKEMSYVEAARGLGASHLRMMARHILPQCIAPYLILATTHLGVAIIIEAALGFLGVGIPPPTPTWGNMLADSLNAGLVPPWWLVLFPGVAITVTVLAFNLLGDGIRDALDPRLRGAV